jgi:hypothetical protein
MGELLEPIKINVNMQIHIISVNKIPIQEKHIINKLNTLSKKYEFVTEYKNAYV